MSNVMNPIECVAPVAWTWPAAFVWTIGCICVAYVIGKFLDH